MGLSGTLLGHGTMDKWPEVWDDQKYQQVRLIRWLFAFICDHYYHTSGWCLLEQQYKI